MRRILIICLMFISFFPAAFSQSSLQKVAYAAGLQAGYNNGLGFQGSFTIRNLAEDFPFSIKLGVGVSFLDPGIPLDAREIFINDATNGVPEKSGKLIDFRADFLYQLTNRTYLYAGPRFSMFTANFNFIGGNEDFDITTNQWGAGVGVENAFRITPMLDLVFNFGYDFFFASTLYGHDTSYSPDGQNVNQRKDFTYDDADKSVNQPKHSFRVMAGLNYNF